MEAVAEATALLELRGLRVVPDKRPLFRALESEMPDLFAEMRADLAAKPFCREFVLCGNRWSVNTNPNNPVLAYYFEDHPELRQKIRVLENHGLVTDSATTTSHDFRFQKNWLTILNIRIKLEAAAGERLTRS
jgi:hypothetical protein